MSTIYIESRVTTAYPKMVFEYVRSLCHPHDDPKVIILQVANHDVNRVLMDIGSCIGIMFFDCFNKLGLLDNDLAPTPHPLLDSKDMLFIIRE